ncbi:MAG: hypothetical protein CMP38_03900 [Rickettsiales bacterium]|nr:hypothetical protein [Rickettsiales bacterium]OUW02921.1 MAG: hypothetical protein CBD16_03795 [Betaproteobacteria bacterium TMED156]
MSDNFIRSCEHWSEKNREEMIDFYSLATVDYEHLAKSKDWDLWLKNYSTQVGYKQIKLLDIACGSGKFPQALLKFSKLSKENNHSISYSLLDPSSFSIKEAAKVLKPPFILDNTYETTLQNFNGEKNFFDIVWATHALYALPKDELSSAIENMLFSLKGWGFIAHATRNSHYIKFYDSFLQAFGNNLSSNFTTAEEIIDVFENLGIDYSVKYLNYLNSTSDKNAKQLEGYLQRCVFNDNVSLQEMLSHPITERYLHKHYNKNMWQFPQEISLIFFKKK